VKAVCVPLRALALGLVAVVPCSGSLLGQAPGTQDVAADVQFMQGMIAHHAQALAMVSLIPGRSDRRDIQLLGQRITISQHDEIKLMQRWLEDHNEPVPTVDSNSVAHMPGTQMAGMSMGANMPMMPGMLTPEQMTALANAKGAEFERLLLTGMIGHHRGALTMVANLLNTRGASQGSDVFTFASGVDADQRAEIQRMQAMLAATPGAAGH